MFHGMFHGTCKECFTECSTKCSTNVPRGVKKSPWNPISRWHGGEANRLNKKLIHRIQFHKAKARKYFLKAKKFAQKRTLSTTSEDARGES